MIRNLLTTAAAGLLFVACSSATAPPERPIHTSDNRSVYDFTGPQSDIRTRDEGGNCSCSDPDWCKYGYDFGYSCKEYRCNDGNGDYPCCCDCGWNCVPMITE